MNKVRIVSAITSSAGITLYLETGKTVELPATGWRTRAIMDEITRPLARHKIVDIDLDAYSLESRIEKKSGGFIRFVREKISNFGNLFGLNSSTAPLQQERETIVAIVNNKKIPGMEKLERQIEYAALHNSKGLERFLDRLSKVIDERGHSVQELLHFMERGDLPIADDGSIVAYKMLYKKDDTHFVDPHTRRVHQTVGSFVSMDAKLVDPSRRTACSTGLHVARRGYVKNFHGNTIMLIKIAPEDVIAVPVGEPDKMRVAGYHIVAVLPKEGENLVRQDKPMTTHAVTAKLLADVIAGDHTGITEDVVIGGPGGTDVTVVPRAGAKQAPKNTNNGTASALDETANQVTVTVKQVAQAVKEAVAEQESKRERDARRKREKRAAEKAVKVIATATPAKAPKKVSKLAVVQTKSVRQLPEKHERALQMHADGMSARAISKELGICRKTISRLVQSK